MDDDIERAWGRLTRWLAAHAPASYDTLRPPAEAGEIDACESQLGLALPGQYKRLLAVSNGADDWDAAGTFRHGAAFLPGGHRLLSAAEAATQTIGLREILAGFDDDGMAGYWWHPEWVLFGRHVAADGMAIDQRPGPAQGGVGEFMHEDSTSFDRAPSLSAFVAAVADCLESGADFLHYRPAVTDNRLDWKVVLPDRLV